MQRNKIALIVVIILLSLWIANEAFKRLFPVRFDSMGNRIITESEIKAAFQKCAEKYGVDYARKVEQLYRKETAHFTSGQFKKTLSPGMEISGGTSSTKTVFPFGWSSLSKFIASNPGYPKSQFYVARMNENGTGIGKTFVGFPTMESAVMFTAWFIKNIRGGRFGYWYSLNETSALSYESNMSKINPKYV